MNIILWITACFLAAVGLVQIIGWALHLLQSPEPDGTAYQVMRLRRDPELLEAQLRHLLMLTSWSVRPSDLLVLVDDDLDEECKAIYRRLLCDIPGVLVCEPGQLESIVR